MPKELLAATTAASATSEFSLHEPENLPASISASGLDSGEFVTLQYHDGTNWVDYYQDEDATPKRITSNNSFLSIYAPGRWRANKSATALSVSVQLHNRTNP